MVVPAEVQQVVHGLHFLMQKCANIDNNLLLSNTVKTAALIVSSVANARKEMFGKYEYVDIETDLEVILR